jgi:hypothetical protein
MDDYKPYTSSTDQLPLPLNALRRRAVPDVPQDVDQDYLMDHLNDPNLDFENPQGKPVETITLETLPPKNGSGYLDTDVESNTTGRGFAPSTSSAPSRNSTVVTFDECAIYSRVPLTFLTQPSASRLTPKFAWLCLRLTILSCPSTPFACKSFSPPRESPLNIF